MPANHLPVGDVQPKSMRQSGSQVRFYALTPGCAQFQVALRVMGILLPAGITNNINPASGVGPRHIQNLGLKFLHMPRQQIRFAGDEVAQPKHDRCRLGLRIVYYVVTGIAIGNHLGLAHGIHSNRLHRGPVPDACIDSSSSGTADTNCIFTLAQPPCGANFTGSPEPRRPWSI